MNFSDKFIDKIALKLKEKRIGPEEIIYNRGDDGNALFFVIKG